MNYFFLILKSAFFDFNRNKGRTILTSLGILIGVLSVVLLTAFGLGLKKYISDQFESLGTNNLRIVPGKPLQGGSFSGSVAAIRFDERDFQNLKRVKNLQFVIPIFTSSVEVIVSKHKESSTLYSTTNDIFAGLNLKTTYGELFTKNDDEKRSKVAVIGPKIAEKLFGTAQSAVGQPIKVSGSSFKVVGVLESKGGGFGGPDLDSYVYIPSKTGYLFNTDKKFVAFIVKAKDSANLEVAKTDLKSALLKRYKDDQFSIIEQTEILNAVSSIFSILNTVLVAIAAISLVVGGIGIMNIMYVTVSERIKEIGIRRALGARKMDILSQFLIESVILSLFGGVLGLGLAAVIVFFIRAFFPAYIDLQSVVLALGVSSGIGIVFGVLPAKKAADLSPIEAIRYE
ncbi:FtsX-like permease family protein [Candidatus Roizmanbacteria bacterium]|nr:FtsX-like permease family protein [Candidatus Roizmanbacteria bacterium]